MSFLHTRIAKGQMTVCLAFSIFAITLSGCNFLKAMSDEGEGGQFAMPAFDGNSIDNNDHAQTAAKSTNNTYKLIDPKTMMQILQKIHDFHL